MALILTIVAVAIGTGLGLRWGGEVSNLTLWRPDLWEAVVGGVVVIALVDIIGITGGFGAFLVVLATSAILAFAVFNVRVGGMILVAAGVALNLLVTVLNWGRPVSASAIVSAGIVKRADLNSVVLTGGRSLDTGAVFSFLGDVIPLPWGQVLSVGDVLVLAGTILVTASVMRLHRVGGGLHGYVNQHGPSGYRNALAALGQGPAPRRGPGLHPSRLGGRRDRHRIPAGRRPR